MTVSMIDPRMNRVHDGTGMDDSATRFRFWHKRPNSPAEPLTGGTTPGVEHASAHPSADGEALPSGVLKRVFSSIGTRAGWRSREGEAEAQDVLGLCHALLSERGEVSGARVAAEVLVAYRALDAAGREAFFDLLSHAFLPDPEVVGQAADAYRSTPSPQTLLHLQTVTDPRSQELFRRLNLAPGGTGALLEMRRHLLGTLGGHPERGGLDADLTNLFRSWFNGGFLLLRRIDWRTPAVVLERLIQYEAVHQIVGWDDLRRRLDADRRCYAFFHPALPDEPLIFIEVALTGRMSAEVRPLLNPKAEILDPAMARCAIFYSITNCQGGLRGVPFGNLLIKQVVEDLKMSFPRVKTFATLSPLPEFRKWLAALDPARTFPGEGPRARIVARLQQRTPGSADAPVPPELRDELTWLCAFYLLHAKHGHTPYDSVARFHLANGARLERLNWLADTTTAGLLRSFGMMVNYVYRLDELERNHDAYARGDRVVASREIDRLEKQPRFAPG